MTKNIAFKKIISFEKTCNYALIVKVTDAAGPGEVEICLQFVDAIALVEHHTNADWRPERELEFVTFAECEFQQWSLLKCDNEEVMGIITLTEDEWIRYRHLSLQETGLLYEIGRFPEDIREELIAMRDVPPDKTEAVNPFTVTIHLLFGPKASGKTTWASEQNLREVMFEGCDDASNLCFNDLCAHLRGIEEPEFCLSFGDNTIDEMTELANKLREVGYHVHAKRFSEKEDR